MEDSNFEVALFGRVSSGKSSLLNKLFGLDLLPVGINPITAIPTRLQYGRAVRAIVTFETNEQEVSIAEFAELVSERVIQGIPGMLRELSLKCLRANSAKASFL